MRSRILAVAVTAAVVAIVLFALPLAVAVRQLYFTNEQGELERAALRAVAAAEPAFVRGDRVELPGTETDVSVALYDASGHRVAGGGPALADRAVARGLTGQVVQSNDSGSLIEVVPVSSGEKVIGVVRAATPTSNVWRRTFLTWGVMVLLAAAAVAVAVFVARRQAKALSQPLEVLAAAARTLGDGDFSVRTPSSRLPEIDQTGEALNVTAERLGQLVERERTFSANASHQLRTPLTGLRLGLETALDGTQEQLREAARDAIGSADELETTIQELLTLARGTAPGTGPALTDGPALQTLLTDLMLRWQQAYLAVGRSLVRELDADAPSTSCPVGAIRQVLDVLVENALQHGAGTVLVVARESGTALAIDVRDEGSLVAGDQDVFERGYSGGSGHGIGLALARDLAEASGGRLVLTRTEPSTVFTLLLPTEA